MLIATLLAVLFGVLTGFVLVVIGASAVSALFYWRAIRDELDAIDHRSCKIRQAPLWRLPR